MATSLMPDVMKREEKNKFRLILTLERECPIVKKCFTVNQVSNEETDDKIELDKMYSVLVRKGASESTLQEVTKLINREKAIKEVSEQIENEKMIQKIAELINKHKEVHDIPEFLQKRQLIQDFTDLINKQKAKGKTMTEVLLKISKENKDFPLMEGTLTYFCGLLNHYPDLVTEESVIEMIELLKKNGVSSRKQWVMLLNASRFHPVVAKALLKCVDDLLEGEVTVCDEDAGAFATLFQYKRPDLVTVKIEQKPSSVLLIEKLFERLIEDRIQIATLDMDYLFRNPGADDQFMTLVHRVIKCCDIGIGYRGQLPLERDLIVRLTCMWTMSELSVSLTSDEDAEALQHLFDLWSNRHIPLRILAINVGSIDIARSLGTIPCKIVFSIIDIFIPGLKEGDEDDTRRRGGNKKKERKPQRSLAEILKTLDPPEYLRGFARLFFPRYRYTSISRGASQRRRGEGIKRLLLSFMEEKPTCAATFPTRCRPEDPRDEKELQKKCKTSKHKDPFIVWGVICKTEKNTVYDVDSWE